MASGYHIGQLRSKCAISLYVFIFCMSPILFYTFLKEDTIIEQRNKKPEK